MAPPISIQLYTVRELAAKDYAGTVEKIAEIGFVAVEPAGFPGYTLEKAVALYDRLGLQVSSAHLALPVGAGKQESIETAKALGITRMVSGLGPDDFKTLDLIKVSCERFNEAGANATAAGLSFGIHNHWWEFLTVAGKPVYQHMLEYLTDDVFFEIDTYWVKTGGCDTATVLQELGDRAPLLHIKDGPCVQGQPMTAVGQGTIDWAPIFAAGTAAEWAIVELDACATDMLTAVSQSYDYLIGQGYARGNK